MAKKKIFFTKSVRPSEPFRVHMWIDTDTLTPVYGIQHKVNGTWAHLVERLAPNVPYHPVFFFTDNEAAARIRELQA